MFEGKCHTWKTSGSLNKKKYFEQEMLINPFTKIVHFIFFLKNQFIPEILNEEFRLYVIMKHFPLHTESHSC